MRLLLAERELTTLAILIGAAPLSDVARDRLGYALAAISEALDIVRGACRLQPRQARTAA
jgi:hypothetical protein